ncbi:MAG TPA: Mor transcription activator family protein [Dyella sp.]|uniref:Mor transcription activator family protein n=1 Tax=Dyella sp. TaxID=1869338 RepID=UPI002F92A258
MKSRAPEMLRELERIVAEQLHIVPGVSAEAAQQTARQVAMEFARQWGGQQVYVPMGRAWLIGEQHKQIVEAVRGNNHAQVAARFGVSVQHVYRVLSQARRARLAVSPATPLAQIDLFQSAEVR